MTGCYNRSLTYFGNLFESRWRVAQAARFRVYGIIGGMLHSNYRPLCPVSLPYRGRQMYMHSFSIAAPAMADGFEDYLDPVAELLDAAGAREGIAHMTVDEKIVIAGASQRRPGPHVDGCFLPEANRWGHDGGG